jgi:hypothetical protein
VAERLKVLLATKADELHVTLHRYADCMPRAILPIIGGKRTWSSGWALTSTTCS